MSTTLYMIIYLYGGSWMKLIHFPPTERRESDDKMHGDEINFSKVMEGWSRASRTKVFFAGFLDKIKYLPSYRVYPLGFFFFFVFPSQIAFIRTSPICHCTRVSAFPRYDFTKSRTFVPCTPLSFSHSSLFAIGPLPSPPIMRPGQRHYSPYTTV